MPSYPLRTTPTTTATPALHRKSPPTCTLSLAHVSASPFHSQKRSSFKIKNSELNLSTMQLDLRVDFSSVISVPVQVHVVDNANTTFSPALPLSSATPPTGVRRSKSKKRTQAKRSDINFIPFPSTSPPATESSTNESFIYSSSSRPNYSSNSSNSSLGTPHVLLRASTINHTPQQLQQAGPKRVRKNTVNVGAPSSTVPPVPASPYSSRRNTPESIAPSVPAHSPPIVSPLPVRIQALRGPALGSGVAVQRSPIELLPERPCSPGPHSIGQQQISVTSLKQQLKSEDTFDPPPYTSPPPPYSASPAGIPASDAKSPPTPTVTPRPLPSILSQNSRIPTPSAKSSQNPTVPSQPRRQRISSSDLKILVFLYRTIMYGVEKRYRAETAARASGYITPPNSYSTSSLGGHVTSTVPLYHHGSATHVVETGATVGNVGSSRFGRFPVIEEEEENEDDQVISSFSSSERRQHKAELEVQDALLAIRLRAFLKAQGIAESELDVQFEGEKSAEEEEEDERMMEEVEQEINKLNKRSNVPVAEPTPQVPERPIRSSPPPLSPVPKPARRRSVLSTSYMIAFLLMKHRMTSAPRKGFGSVSSGKDKRVHTRGATSGLRVCSWAANQCNGETVVEELEEEFDSCSVVDWYAGMDY